MSDDFRLDILPAPQRRLWDELGSVPRGFVLYGGTAIALHLGHRRSIDFDFFYGRSLDPARLIAETAFLEGAVVVQQEPNTLSVTVERGGPIKVSFFGLPRLLQVRRPHIAPNGVRIAGLLDLGGTKASVVQQRAEAKDYLDIDALLMSGKIDLLSMLAAARAIYGSGFNPQATLKALSYFGDGNLATVPEPAQARLVKAAAAVDLDRLPDLQASPLSLEATRE